MSQEAEVGLRWTWAGVALEPGGGHRLVADTQTPSPTVGRSSAVTPHSFGDGFNVGDTIA